MAQKYTLAASSTSTDRLLSTGNALIHLSDGTPVFLYYDGTNVQLAYTADRATVTAIATISANFAVPLNHYLQRLSLARDASDNLYVLGADVTNADTLRVQAFAKGSGRTWIAKAEVKAGAAFSSPGFRIMTISAVWCNTAGSGYLAMVVRSQDGYTGFFVVSADAALTGSGTLVSDFHGNQWLSTSGAGALADLDGDGFGSTTVVGAAAQGSTTGIRVFSATIDTSGVATITNLATESTGNLQGGTNSDNKLRVVRCAPNRWAVVFPSTTAGRYMAARYSSTAQLTAGTDSGAPASMPLNTTGGGSSSQAWDVFLDPAAGSRIWVLAQGATATLYRQSCDLSSGVSWAASATADDTLSPWVNQGTPPDLRVVKKPTGMAVDWQAFAQTAPAPTYALLGDYTAFNTAPNAPTGLAPALGAVDRSVIQRLSWTFSDPNAGDSQSKFDLQWRHKGTADAWNTVTQTTPNNFYDVPANTFPAEDIEWQVRTYDQAGAVGPYSPLAYFTAADPATPPTITAPTSGGTVSQNPTNVTWSTAGQQGYQLRRVRDNAGVADTTTVYYDTGQITDATTRTVSVPFETNNRWEWVQVRVQQGGLWSAWSSIRVNVSYTQPATATLVAAGNNTTGAITVTITNPTPSGGQPTVSYNDVYVRTVGDTGPGVRIAAQVANNGTATYWTPASGVAYQFLIRTFGSNSTSADSAWTG